MYAVFLCPVIPGRDNCTPQAGNDRPRQDLHPGAVACLKGSGIPGKYLFAGIYRAFRPIHLIYL